MLDLMDELYATKLNKLIKALSAYTDIDTHPENWAIITWAKFPPGTVTWFRAFNGCSYEVVSHADCPPGSAYVVQKVDLPVSCPNLAKCNTQDQRGDVFGLGVMVWQGVDNDLLALAKVRWLWLGTR